MKWLSAAFLVLLLASLPAGSQSQSTQHGNFKAKEEPVYDVTNRAYGAIENDGLDDRAAVQLAIDAACTDGGGTVFFPRGTFNLDEIGSGTLHSLVLGDTCDGVRLVGSGIDATLLQGMAGTHDAGNNRTIVRLVDCSRCGIEDLAIDGDPGDDATYDWDNGWRGTNVDFSYFNNVRAVEFDNHGFSIRADPGVDGSDDNIVSNGEYQGDRSSCIVYANNAGGTKNVRNQLTNLNCHSAGIWHGLEIRYSDDTIVTGGHFHDNVQSGINIEEGANNTIIQGVNASDNGKAGLMTWGTDNPPDNVNRILGLHISGGQFNNNTTQGIRCRHTDGMSINGSQLSYNLKKGYLDQDFADLDNCETHPCCSATQFNNVTMKANVVYGAELRGDDHVFNGGIISNNDVGGTSADSAGIKILSTVDTLTINGTRVVDNLGDLSGNNADISVNSNYILKRFQLHSDDVGFSLVSNGNAYVENEFIAIQQAPHINGDVTTQAKTLSTDVDSISSGSVLTADTANERFFDLRMNRYATQRTAGEITVYVRIKNPEGDPATLRWRKGGLFSDGDTEVISASADWAWYSTTIPYVGTTTGLNNTAASTCVANFCDGGVWDGTAGWDPGTGQNMDNATCHLSATCVDSACDSGPNVGEACAVDTDCDGCNYGAQKGVSCTLDSECTVCTDAVGATDDYCQHFLVSARLDTSSDQLIADGYSIETAQAVGFSGGGTTDAGAVVHLTDAGDDLCETETCASGDWQLQADGDALFSTVTIDPSTTPAMGFDDNDDGDDGINDAKIVVNCPTTDDCDMAFQADGGTGSELTEVFRIDTEDDGLQTVVFTGPPAIPGGTSNPADCLVGSLFWDTDDDTDGELNVCKTAGGTWKAITGGGGGMTSFDIDGDNNSPQTVANGEEALFVGGNAVTTTAAATRQVTVAVTADSIDHDELAATITMADGDLVDFGSNVTSATEGLMVPAHATDCSTAIGEGQVCWEEDAQIFYVGNGASAVDINGSGSGDMTQAVYDSDSSTFISSVVDSSETVLLAVRATASGCDAGTPDECSLGELVAFTGGIVAGCAEAEYADADASAMPAVGMIVVAADNISCDGRVLVSGAWDFSADVITASTGDDLYVSTTAGDITTTRPTGVTAAIQKVGYVIENAAGTNHDIVAIFGAQRSNDVPNLEDAKFWVGNGSNVATAVSMSGGATMDNLGAVTLDADLTAIAALTVARGDLMTGIAGPAWGNLAVGSANDVLLTDGTDPSWGHVASANITDNEISFADMFYITLPADPAFLVDECALAKTGTGGGFLCEGSAANDNETFWRFPDIDEADSTYDICTAAEGCTLTGTQTIGGTSVIETGAALSFGDNTDATITHTYDTNPGTDVTIAYTDSSMTVTGALAATGAVTGSNLSGTNTGDNDQVGTVTNTAMCQGDGSAVQCDIDDLAALNTAISSGLVTGAHTDTTKLPLAGGTLTGEVTVDDLGFEFTEGDTLTDCSTFAATGGGIFYDDSEGIFKKCQDNVLTDMDTGAGTVNTADIADVNVTQTELAELETIGATVIEAADWTAVAAMSGVNTGDEVGAVTNTAVCQGDGSVVQCDINDLAALNTAISSGLVTGAHTDTTKLPLAGGTLTGEVTVDDLGFEFTAGDTLTDCSTFSATGGGIFYDDSEGIFKKCQDNVLTDMDTSGGAGAWTDEGTELRPTDGETVQSDTTFGAGDWKLEPDGDGFFATVTTESAATPNILFVDSTTSGEGKISVDDAAGPESVMTFQVDTGTGTLTTFMDLDGVTDTVELYKDLALTGTATWGGTSILESGAAFQFGDASDATLTHTYANTGTNVTVAYSTGAMAVTGNLTATNLSNTNTGDNDEVGTKTAGDLCINDGTDVNCTVNLESELETALDDIDVIVSTEIDTTNELMTILTDEGNANTVLHGGAGSGGTWSGVAVADIVTGTDGQLITWDASGNPAVVATGTNGHFLESNGAGAAPVFRAIVKADISDQPSSWFSTVLETPADADNFSLFKAPHALTITDIDCIVDPAEAGSDTVVITVQECDSGGINCAGVDGATTITCDDDGAADDGSLSNGPIDSGDWVAIDIGTVTGTVTQVAVTVTYTID